MLIEVLILSGFLLNLIKKIRTPSSDILYYKKVMKNCITSNVNEKLEELSKGDDMTMYCGTHPDIEDIRFV